MTTDPLAEDEVPERGLPEEENPDSRVETTTRVATWNVWWQFENWEERQGPIASTLDAIAPDLVTLQEVFAQSDRDQAAELANRLGFSHVMHARLDLGGLLFGNAVLSRWPIVHDETLELPALPDADELRLAVHARIEGPRGPIDLYTTHLNHLPHHSAIRQEQVAAIAGWIARTATAEQPPILTGDFNADPFTDEIRMLTGHTAVPAPPVVFQDAWACRGDGPGYTWDNENSYVAPQFERDYRIDYVFSGWPDAHGRGHVVDAALFGTDSVDGVQPSDHYGVMSDIRY